MENPVDRSAETEADPPVPPPPALQDQSTSESLGDSSGPHRPLPPLSPLTGGYLLIVVGEPHSERHKEIILQKIAKAFLSWDVDECHVSLEKELNAITGQAPVGEEARFGERLIQYATENLVTEILIHPQLNTLHQCMKNLLSSFTKHRHIIHAGYTFAGNGSWILQDGTLSISDLIEALHEPEVLRVMKAYENSISIDVHCAPEGDWRTERFQKEPATKLCTIRVNPGDVMTAGNAAISAFIDYLSPFLEPANIQQLLQPTDIVGNIRFTHPTLYVFPGGQGDAALFGINGFNMLIDGGFARKACFWDFARHLDRLDAVLLTRLNNSTVNGISAVLQRKKMNHVYPQIGHFFCNLQDRKIALSPDGDKDKDSLIVNLAEEGHEIVANLRHLALKPHPCYRDGNQIDPVNLYHKVGHGKLDMYVISPARDSQAVKEFLAKWTTNDSQLFSNTGKKVGGKAFEFPLQNLVSICALLVWQPANPNDTITRILFPGSTPQHKIFEGLEKLRHLEFLKHPVCSASSIGPSLAVGAATRSLSKTRPSRIIENKQVESKPGIGKSQARQVRSRSEKTPSREIKSKLDINKLVDEKKEIESNLESPLMKLDNRILSKDEQIENITKEIQKIELADNEDQKKKVVHRSKYDMRYVKSKVDSRAPSKSIDRKKGADKKSEGETSPPATPKKTSVNGTATKKEKAKAGTKPGGKTTLSPPTTPAKSAKEANNRKVVEARLTKTTNKSGTTATTAQKKKEETPPPASAVAPKTERKPISRRPKGSQSPVNKSKGKEGAEAPKKNQIKPKVENVAIAAATGTAAATLAIGKTILDLNKGAETEKTETKEKTTEKTVGEESEIGKPNETDTMAVNKQIKPTKSQETEGGVEEGGEEIEGEEEEYLIITKEEYVEEKEEGEGEGEESLKASGSAQEEQAKDETEEEGEIKKLLREEKESEKKQKAVDESTKDAPIGVKEEEEQQQQQQQKKQIDVEKVNEKENEKFDRDERAAKEEEETEPDPQADQKYSGSKEHKEGESLPEEKISNTIETSATTAPTLPEDEKVEIDKAGEGGRQEEEDIVQAEEMVEEKYIQEETKEDKKIDEDVMAVPQSLPKLEFNNAEDAESGLMMQPGQKKPREVVKTPDEVADLPMHEEVDPRMYSSGDYTKELRKRSTEYDSIGVDQISEKGKEKEQIIDSLDYNEEDKEVEKREEKVPKEETRENKSEDKEEIKENMDDSIASKYLNIIDELEKSAGSISKEVKEDTRVEDATVVVLGETKPGEPTTEGKEESVDRPVEEHREIPVSIDEAKRDLEEEKFALSQEPSKMTPDKPKSVSNGHEVATLGENVDRGSPSSLEASKPNEMPKKDGYREMSPTEHLKGDSNRSSPIETSGKSSPAEMRKYSVEKVKVISQELDEENAREDLTQGQDVWENSDKLEHAQSPIMDSTFCKKEQINLDNILDKNGKDTEGTLHRLDVSQPTFQVAENIEKSDDSVPQNDAMGTPAIGLEEDADGEIVEGSISQKHISEKKRSSPVESSEAATKKKLSLTESEDLKKGSQASSGKHTPIDSGDEAETRKNLVESSAEGKPESLLKPSKEVSDKSFPRDVKASASGETSPTSRESSLQYVEPLVSGQISQKDSESPPSRKQSLQDLEAPTSGKSSPQRLEGTTSRKSSTQCVEAPISGKSSPSNRIESEGSGKTSPQNIKESVSGESSPQNVTPRRSGKSSPQVVEADRSGSGSPFVEVDATTSGKMSPKGSESSDQALIEKAPPSTYKSGQSSPQVLEEVTSRKSIPLDSEIFPSDKTSPEIASRENIPLHPEKQSGKSSPLLPDSMTEPPEQTTVQNETVVRPEGTSPCFDSRRSSKSFEPEPSPQHSVSPTKGTIQTGDFSKESFQCGDEKEEEKEKKEEKINEIPEKDESLILKTNAFKEKMTNPQDSSPKSSSPINSDGDEIDDRQGFLHQIEQSETMKSEFSPSLEEGKDSRKRSVVDEIEGQSPQVSNLNALEKKSSRTSTRTPSPSSDASVVPTRPEKETEKSENEKFLMAERRASDSPSPEPQQKESSGKSSPATPGKALSPVSGKPTSESVSMALADAATSATFSLEKENLAKSSSPSPVDISPLSLDERKDGAKDEKPEIRSVNVSGEGASPKTLKRIVCEDGNSSGMSTPDRSHIEKSDASVPNGVESEDEIEKGILESEKQEKESQISDVLSEEEEELKGLGVEDDDDDEAAGASDTRNGHFVPGTKNEKEVYDEGMIRSGDSSRGDIRKDEKEDINHLVKIGVRDTDGVQSEDEEVSDLKSEVKRMLVTASSEDGGTETEICIQGGVKTLKEVLAEDEKGPKREEVEEEFSNLILEARKEYMAQRSRKTSTSSPAEPADDVDDNESVESEMGSEREELGSLLMQARQELAFVRSRSRETDERKEPETKKLLKSTTVNTTESTKKEGDIVVKIITKITTVKEEQDDGNVKVTTTTETKTIGGKDDGVAVEVNTAILSGTDTKKEKEDELGPIELGTSSETCSRFTTVSAKESEEIGTSSRRESQGDGESRRTSTSSDVPIFQEDLLRRKDSGKMEEFRRSSTEMSPLKTTYITSYGESESLMTSSFYGNLPGSKEEEMKAEHVRAFSRKGKGYESVTEIGPNGEKTERTYFYEAEEDPEKTRTEKPKFVKAYYTEEGIKRGGEQPRFGHGFHEMDIPEENIILEETRYVQKFHKDKITEEEEEEEEEEREDDEGDDIRGEPEKFKFVKAMFPAEKQSQIDFAQAVEEHKAARGSSLLQHTEEIEEDKNKTGSEANEDLKVEEKKDVIEGWGKPLRLPLPPKNLSKNYKYPGQNISTTSSLSTPSDNSDSVSNWGQPMNLPSPGPPAVQNGISEGLATKVPPISNKDAPGKEKFQLKKGGENKGSGTNTPNRRSQSPAKPTERRAASAGRIGKSGSNSYIYLDLTYVPHHGNSYYINVEFFKKVRARYYVFSGTEPSKEVYNALLEAKQTWEDKNLEVTIIPTYDTDILGYWVAENEEILAKHKIDLSPSASRCTINLQDHETSCSAYRLEF